MFRLYGKKESKEGTGVSLVFNKNFFLTDFSSMQSNKILSSEETEQRNKELRQPLAWVLYYDKNKNRLFFYPRQDDLEPTIISLKEHKNKWNNFPIIENNLEYSFHKLLAEMKNFKKEKMQDLGIKILYKLRYFIKLSDFAEEKELRVLQLIDPANKSIYDDGKKLYKNYLNIWKYDSLKSIIFGPKAISSSHLELYENRLWKSHQDVSIEISDAPLA